MQVSVWANRQTVTSDDVPILIEDEPIVSHGVTLMQLDEAIHCRWIIGEDLDGQPRYCGEDRRTGEMGITRFYCAEHSAIAVSEAPGPSMKTTIWVNAPNGRMFGNRVDRFILADFLDRRRDPEKRLNVIRYAR